MPVDSDCDDGEFCNGTENCSDGVCGPGSEPNCDDGLFCNGPEQCDTGVGCVSGGNPCPDPDVCDENNDNCGGCDAPAAVAEGARYLAITPTAGDDPVAILVTSEFADPTVSCISNYVQADGTLDATPVFQTPAVWDTVHLGDDEIIPSTTYLVHTDCRYEGSGSLSSATEVRTWLWGDVNNDGVVFLDDVALVYDGAQGIFNGTTVQNLDLEPCRPDGVIDAADINAVQDALSGGGFSCPVPCEPCLTPGAPPDAESVPAPKNRYLSFVPGRAGRTTALRVKLIDMPAEFEEYEGSHLWVGPPQEISEQSGSSGTDPPTFQGAPLLCEPTYLDWSTVGLIHVFSKFIVPGAAFDVQVIDELCDPAQESAYSAALPVTTSLYGDVVGDCSESGCSPPQGAVDFDDISAIVDKFIGFPGALIKARSDITPETVDFKVDFTDIPDVVDAFLGLPYRYPPRDPPCPPR